MTTLEVVAVSARTATLLIAKQAHRYHLPKPVHWQCVPVDGGDILSGESSTVAVFLSDLLPDTKYKLSTNFAETEFRTELCTGLINVVEHGADPTQLDNVAAFRRAIEAVPIGGTLLVPAGHYVSSPLFLKSHMTLLLAEGAVIAAPNSREGWPILAAWDEKKRCIGTWEGLPEACFASVLTAIDCEHLTITGRGCIDGGGDREDWWSWPKETREGARRPRTVMLSHCHDVVLSGVTVRNSPSWTVHPVNCVRLLAAAIKIENPPDSPNTDGFNPESCVDTTVVGVKISVGDDCIAVKSGKRGAAPDLHLAETRGLHISNCLMERGHGAVVLGSEMSGGIFDVRISRCDFQGTDRGLRIKTRRGRGGKVSGITLESVHMQGVATPLAINAFYFCDADGKSEAVQSRETAAVGTDTPEISDINVIDVSAYQVQHAAAAFLGLPEAPILSVRIENFRVSYDPAAVPEVPLMACRVSAVRHAGVISEFAEVSGDIAIMNDEEAEKC